MIGFPKDYPVSTAGLDPTQRCIDLRRRAMWAKQRQPIRLAEQMIDNLVAALSCRGFTACGGWHRTGDGDITVFQMGGGYHRDSTGRKYSLRGGRAVSVQRTKPDA